MVLYRNFGFPILNIKEKHMQSKTSENVCFPFWHNYEIILEEGLRYLRGPKNSIF